MSSSSLNINHYYSDTDEEKENNINPNPHHFSFDFHDVKNEIADEIMIKKAKKRVSINNIISYIENDLYKIRNNKSEDATGIPDENGYTIFHSIYCQFIYIGIIVSTIGVVVVYTTL
jgi:hypothetical protein